MHAYTLIVYPITVGVLYHGVYVIVLYRCVGDYSSCYKTKLIVSYSPVCPFYYLPYICKILIKSISVSLIIPCTTIGQSVRKEFGYCFSEDLDDVVLSYITSIVEEPVESVDLEEFLSIMDAYIPGFSQITV